jgi:two-component system, sensor histidine kinase PdtaS
MSTQQSTPQSIPHHPFRPELPAPVRTICDPVIADCPLGALRDALAREEVLLREKDALILEQQALRRESDHRLLNGLQIVVSLLSLQSRAAPTQATAAQLSIAAHRVAAIERIHRRLHTNDGAQTVAFRNYLEEFCRDFSGIMNSQDGQQAIQVEGAEAQLPAATAIPLGFIVNELVTNAVKYGTGNVRIRLDSEPGGGHVLSVSNRGPSMPEGYDPASSKGLGMKIVQSFARKIGGKLLFARDEGDQGARISVLFS